MSIRSAAIWMLCVTAFSAANCFAQDDLTAKINSLAKPYVDSKTVVGLSIGVIKGDQVIDLHLGSTDGKADKPDGDTVYEIGSVSKVFTGILLGDAVARGDVKLDQPAQELLPSGVTVPKSTTRPITLLDMSIHQSGLPRLPDNMPSLTSDNPYSDYTSTLAHEFLSKYKLTREPGTKQEYSNFAVSLLGHMLCDKAGKGYDALLTDRITGPLGMTDTHVELTDSMKQRLAKPFTGIDLPSANWDWADMPGAGGIRSTTKDMLKFAQACLKSPDNATGKAMDLAWKQHHKGSGAEATMGLGWHFAGDTSTRWHNGQTGGYHAMLTVNRDLNTAVVVLTNTSNSEVDQLAGDINQTLAGVDVQPKKFDKIVEVDVKIMKRLEGRYQLAPTFVFDVKVDDGKLMVGVTNQQTVQVYAKSETEWFYKVVKASLEFDLNESGKAKSLTLVQNGIRLKATRIK